MAERIEDLCGAIASFNEKREAVMHAMPPLDAHGLPDGRAWEARIRQGSEDGWALWGRDLAPLVIELAGQVRDHFGTDHPLAQELAQKAPRCGINPHSRQEIADLFETAKKALLDLSE